MMYSNRMKRMRFVKRKAALVLLSILWTIVSFSGHIKCEEQLQAADDTIITINRPDSTVEIAVDGGTVDPKLKGFRLVQKLPRGVWYGEGERLDFSIQYGLIYAGNATMEIRNIAEFDGLKAYHIMSVARTNEVFDLIYKVRDRVESFMDYDNLFSVKFEKHLREGRYRKDENVVFDQKNHYAIYRDKRLKIAPRTQDFLSAFYYIRTLDLEVGEAVAMANHTSGKNYPIYIKVLRRQRVSVPAGEFDCIEIEPVLQTSTIFEQKGRLTIWLTDDNLKMPVMMRSKVIVGAFEAVLKDYKLSSDEKRIFVYEKADGQKEDSGG